jgi:gamma-glutamyltranspeptidase/glutathione hydrolase
MQVSTTYTVNASFGAVGGFATGTCFLRNDEIDDFMMKVREKNLYGLFQGVANIHYSGKHPRLPCKPC